MGGKVVSNVWVFEDVIVVGGVIIYEVGIVCMGVSDVDFVINFFGQVWDVFNLYLFDGVIFVFKVYKNLILIILVFVMCGVDYMVMQMKQGVF